MFDVPGVAEATEGKADILVATSGTAGTITGLTRYLREKNPEIVILADNGMKYLSTEMYPLDKKVQ